MLHGVPRSIEVGGHSFPGREDYLNHLKITDADRELDKETYIAIQKDWHIRGQNGCVFAMHAARNLDGEQWSYDVYKALPEAAVLRQAIVEAVDNQNNQLASLLFPDVNTTEKLHELIAIAGEAGCIIRQEDIDDINVLRLRWRLGEVESWVLGFIPTDDVPATRRAPFTELVFRTKQKTKVIHESLNNDPTQAHVADLDLGFDSDVVERLMAKSTERTVRLLGGEAARNAAHGAKAKTTYGVATIDGLEPTDK